MSAKISAIKAIQAVTKKLPIRSDRALNEWLDPAVDSKAEAYRLGAEEAQNEIYGRMQCLLMKEKAANEAKP